MKETKPIFVLYLPDYIPSQQLAGYKEAIDETLKDNYYVLLITGIFTVPQAKVLNGEDITEEEKEQIFNFISSYES